MVKILVLNGPNLNRLGVREPAVYGKKTLKDLEEDLCQFSKNEKVQFSFFQSNHEGDVIDAIHDAEERFDGIILNPGAFTHYSYAIRDAISSVSIPVVEVHISNVHNRESFRHHSVTAPATIGQIVGFGFYGYQLAAQALIHHIRGNEGEITEN
ncbi:type II 3-dehydroquinate dehydratase [Bacillus alveayuensis]|jgi:3-dehydroquinate dehydratase-2|uniref:3-dehydroquinate dehydratase n=1 Tax=Aeribacillus alveayuensis TaxID=279215 RepID=A0ABT9VK86_9BACI|nr:type II 3-dehydroquinate dehydratase [Bacillus alveayuensis]MDQ0161380.1 3-dehydroquinate dehydratase-2 [Bacillus alveayuensis]